MRGTPQGRIARAPCLCASQTIWSKAASVSLPEPNTTTEVTPLCHGQTP
jgi:hypothetical protein